jgi:hypothetical protein
MIRKKTAIYLIAVLSIIIILYLTGIFTPQAEEKSSFLLKTSWGQRGIYAKFAPDNNRVGCWSTAIAQILYFHRLKPSGITTYQCTTGYLINENLDSYSFNWDLFVNRFEPDTKQSSIDEVAKYSYFTSVVVGKDFGTNTYIKGEPDMVTRLENHFKCKVKRYHFFYSDLMNKQMQMQIRKLIKTEIDNARPFMLYFSDRKSFGHAVAVDGYRIRKNKFFVHINMGWGGKGNGWYDLFERIDNYYDDLQFRLIMIFEPI